MEANKNEYLYTGIYSKSNYVVYCYDAMKFQEVDHPDIGQKSMNNIFIISTVRLMSIYISQRN